MAATPPAQIRAEARTPPTPLHGSAYHDESSPRYNFRSSIRRTPEQSQLLHTQTPKSNKIDRAPAYPQASSLHSSLHSPQATPKRKSGRPAQVMSPTSPESEHSAPSSSRVTAKQSRLLSAGTIMAEGMLPTPVKTPRKNQASKSQVTARALFQDSENPETLFKSPRKSRKPARYNGFSLESFSTDDNSQDQIQIFTDSRDRVPEVDTSESNPFYEPPSQPHKVHGTSKRRKVDGTAKVTESRDPQVQEAIDHDDGMVYVFRGKKVYRRFDDGGEEEEVIDTDGVDFDRQHHASRSKRPIKTLTRKSIRPKRLFQATDGQQVDEEEAETEIEDQPDDALPSQLASPQKLTSSDDQASSSKRKKTSPFDSWMRVKAGSRSASTSGRKRTADEAIAT